MFHVVCALVLKQKVEKFMFPMIQLSTGCVQVKKKIVFNMWFIPYYLYMESF